MRPHALLASLALLATALAGCGDSGRDDGDGDGLHDSSEREGWHVTVDSLTERTRRHVASDPAAFDSDGDGLPDQEEFFLQSDPGRADTDGDGLTDCQEVRHTGRAACEDLDFGGPFDGGHGTDPRKADSDPGASPYVLAPGFFTDRTGTLPGGRPDSGDGIPDGEEVAGYEVLLPGGAKRTVRTDPRNADSDGDRLDDGEERHLYRSDPTVEDSDGDACADGADPVPDAEERVRPGLASFTLLRDTGAAPGAELSLSVTLANVAARVPAQGTLRAEAGRPLDLAPHDPPAARSADCTFTPRFWVPVFVAAADEEPGGARLLDITSRTVQEDADTVGTVYWHLLSGQLSWHSDGEDPWPAEQGAVFEGADARLELRPRLEAER